MAAIRTILLSLSLLILSAAQASSGELKEQQTTKYLAAMQGVREALECFGEMMQQSLLLHRQLKEQIGVRNGNTNSVKTEVAASQRVARIIQEIGALDNQLENKDRKVLDLELKLAESRQQVLTLSGSERRLKSLVQDLEKRLAESLRQVEHHSNNERYLNEVVEDLERKLTESHRQQVDCSEKKKTLETKMQYLNNKLVQSQKLVTELEKSQEPNDGVAKQNTTEMPPVCEQHHKHEIKKLVLEFISNKNWSALKKGLMRILDVDSKVYSQLYEIRSDVIAPLWLVGRNAYVDLASLLLCAGLPVDTTDRDGDSMLHGAAWCSSVQLVKMLVDHGADVNACGTGWTPLMRSAFSGQLDVAKLLVQAGARTTDVDVDGHTPLYFARISNHTDVEQYLARLSH